MSGHLRAVVGFDDSADAWAALHHAAAHCDEVIAVYAEPHQPDVSSIMVPGLLGPIPETPAPPPATPREHPIFGGLSGDTIDGTPLERVVVTDRPAPALIAVAQDRDADEIVIGTRRHGRVRCAISSVSHDLIHDADRPVVVVPPPSGQPAEAELKELAHELARPHHDEEERHRRQAAARRAAQSPRRMH